MDILTLALLAVLPVIAVLAAVRDLTTMTIQNWMSLVLLAAFVPAALTTGLEWRDLGIHLGIGLAALGTLVLQRLARTLFGVALVALLQLADGVVAIGRGGGGFPVAVGAVHGGVLVRR